jgi:hypothetical protein
MVAEKSGFSPVGGEGAAELEEYAERLAREALEVAPSPPPATAAPARAETAPAAAPRAR